MAVAPPAQKLTEAEYLAIERKAEFKSEIYDGEMFAMSGGTWAQSVITTEALKPPGKRLRLRGEAQELAVLEEEGAGIIVRGI